MRFLDGEPQAAAGSAAAFICPFVEGTLQAAAATAGLEENVRAGAATDLRDAMVTDGVFCLNAFGGHSRFGMETDCGAGVAATDLLDAMGSTAIVLGDNGVLHSVCMGTVSAVAAANSFDFEGVESAKGHGNATSVQGDTGGTAFSLLHHSLIRDFIDLIHSTIPSMHVHILVLIVLGLGLGSVVWELHVHLCCLCCVFSRVDDDVDDACMDGSNSLIQGSGCHATACACSDALQNSRQVRGHCLRGGTKCSSMGSGAKVWLSDEIRGSLSHQKPESLHVETWAGAQECPSQEGFQVRDFPAGCASVSFPACCSDLTSVLPGPGSEIRKQLGWIQLEKTEESGVWFFRGAFQGEDLFSSLAVSGDWVKKGSYRTAWSVPGDSLCSCSYAYGHGPAIGPHTGKRCWVLLSWLWRTIAPLMKPWCAEGELPTAANLNLYRGGTSRVIWHSDNEPLFGGSGVHKLIVSVSFGAPVLFKRRGRSCLDSGERSCWLGHGDILVMDGQCQDEFLHCTSPGLEHERINVTYRWIRQHTHFCPL